MQTRCCAASPRKALQVAREGRAGAARQDADHFVPRCKVRGAVFTLTPLMCLRLLVLYWQPSDWCGRMVD